MEDNHQFFVEKFCNEAIENGNRFYEHKFAPIRSELELCEYDNRLVIIQSNLSVIRRELRANNFKLKFSLNDIKNNLRGSLEKYFETTPFKDVKGVEFDNTIKHLNHYEIDDETGILKVRSFDMYGREKSKFEFNRFNSLNHLQLYIGWALLFLELQKLEVECNAKPIENKELKLPKDELLKVTDNSPKDIDIAQPNVDAIELDNSEENIIAKTKEKLKDMENDKAPLKLSDFFNDLTKYNKIMEILVKNKKCAPNTYLWIDKDGGYKTQMVALLIYLNIQGYYKNNTELKPKQIQNICQNIFGIKMSIETIKIVKPKDAIILIKYIPIATSLDNMNNTQITQIT